MNPVIEVASLRKNFKGRDGTSRTVLKDLDLTVVEAEAFPVPSLVVVNDAVLS